jgi:hypothetical protein
VGWFGHPMAEKKIKNKIKSRVLALERSQTAPKGHRGGLATLRPPGLEVVELPPWLMGDGSATPWQKKEKKKKRNSRVWV